MKGYKLAEKFPVIFKSDGMLHEINQIIKRKESEEFIKEVGAKVFHLDRKRRYRGVCKAK